MSSPRPPEYHYSPVTNEEEKGLITESSSSPSRPQFSRLRWPLLCLLLVASSLIVGCLIGIQFSESRSLENDAPIKLDWLSIVFQSNRTFLQRPSEESDRTWESLYPADHGFFDYPDTDPLRSTFAGFHQLHCVDTLRRGFYEVWDSKQAVMEGKDIADIPETITLDHVLHCIEFLRQSVMCHADTTVETKDPLVKGVVGFGIAHPCRDWNQMVKWVNVRNGK